MAKPKLTDYKKLKEIWYAKLEKSGFNDIEQDEYYLKSLDGPRFTRDRSLHSWRSKQEYYYMAEHFLNSHKFESKIQKIIWEYHTNGISARDIVKVLKKVRVKNMERTVVWETIKELEGIMKEKYISRRPVDE